MKNSFRVPGDPQKSTPWTPNITQKIFNIKNKHKISRLNFAGDIQHIRNIFPVFYV